MNLQSLCHQESMVVNSQTIPFHTLTTKIIKNYIPWDIESTVKLLNEVKLFSTARNIPWKNIAPYLPNRTPKQCTQRYETLTRVYGLGKEKLAALNDKISYRAENGNYLLLSGSQLLAQLPIDANVTRNHVWSMEDDMLLLNALKDQVSHHNEELFWDNIAIIVGQSKNSCYHRYYGHYQTLIHFTLLEKLKEPIQFRQEEGCTCIYSGEYSLLKVKLGHHRWTLEEDLTLLNVTRKLVHTAGNHIEYSQWRTIADIMHSRFNITQKAAQARISHFWGDRITLKKLSLLKEDLQGTEIEGTITLFTSEGIFLTTTKRFPPRENQIRKRASNESNDQTSKKTRLNETSSPSSSSSPTTSSPDPMDLSTEDEVIGVGSL